MEQQIGSKLGVVFRWPLYLLKGVALIDNKRVWNAVLGCNLRNDRIIFIRFQGNLDSILKSRDITLPTKVSSQSYGFSSSHVWMWELDYKESWALRNWCFWTVVLEKTLESPLGCKEIQPVHPKGNWSWISIGRNDAEAETPILWPLDAKNWLVWKGPDAGKD